MYKNIFKNIIFFITITIFSVTNTNADDVADLSGISAAAGSSAGKAVEQLSADTAKVSTNISEAISGLGTNTTSGVAGALDATLSEASKAMEFAQQSLEAGNITAAVQTMSLVESATDMALASVPSVETLDMTSVDFANDFSPAEMSALSNIAGQMGVGKVVSLQKMAGQMGAATAAGFDAKGMMSNMDAQGVGIGTAMQGMEAAGMVDMEAVAGASTFSMDSFSPESFASMNVGEMGMEPSMMVGALNSLPIGAASAALESFQAGTGKMAKGFENLQENMTGAIAATMTAKGMGTEMAAAMGDSIGINGMGDLAIGLEGAAGMSAIGEALAGTGAMSDVAASLVTAFSTPTTGIASTMNASVGMISGAISGKKPNPNTAVEIGNASMGTVASSMVDASPATLDMPESISESGMMMGSMVMAKSMMAAGLPGAMAPPKGLTSTATLTDVPTGVTLLGAGAQMNQNMSAMTGMTPEAMSTMGMDKMASSTGLTLGMMSTMGAAGVSGMDVTSVMSANVAGLGSKAIGDLATGAASGSLSGAVLGDMMQTGVVNQGTMAAMGSTGMETLGSAMGMEGGDMGLASASGGLVGMGEPVGDINPEAAKSMGMTGGGLASAAEASLGTGVGTTGSMNLGQVSAAMGTGATPEAAIGSAAAASNAASESGAGISGAAMGAAASAQGAAAASMGAGAVGGAMGEAMGDAMGAGDMGKAMGDSMSGSMSGSMGAGMAGAMGGMAGSGMGDAMSGAMGGAAGGDLGGAMGGLAGSGMGGAMGDIGGAVGGAMGDPGGPGGPGGPGDGQGGQGEPSGGGTADL